LKLTALTIIYDKSSEKVSKRKPPGQQHDVTSRTAIFSRHDIKQRSSAHVPGALAIYVFKCACRATPEW